jgi:peptidase E
MRQQYKNYYQFAKPPKALLKAKLDNIAIVPASMLPFTKTIQQMLTNLPKGAVFLCHAEENARQRKLLERVEETFKQQGHVVKNLSMEEVYKNSLHF